MRRAGGPQSAPSKDEAVTEKLLGSALADDADDVEAASASVSVAAPAATTTAALAGALWLAGWFVNNIAVTLLNKWAFANVDFPYPYTVRALALFENGRSLYWRNLICQLSRSLLLVPSWDAVVCRPHGVQR